MADLSPFQRELEPCLIHTIHVAPATGVSGKGDLTYGTPVSVKCLIEFDSRLEPRIASKREELVTRDQIVSIDRIEKKDFIWYPGKTVGAKSDGRQPHRVEPMYDPETGEISHYETTV